MPTEKTEQATPKKLKDAHRKGSVTRSTDLVAAATLFAVLCALIIGSKQLLDALRHGVNAALDFTAGRHSMQAFIATLTSILGVGALSWIAVSLSGLLGALLGNLPQVGMQVSFEPVMPKLSTLSPASGLKRIFSPRSLFELAKMVLKAAIIGIVLWRAVLWIFPLMMRGVYEPLDQLAALLWFALLRVLGVGFVLYLVIGAGDYLLQRWVFLRSQRMSKDEVKQERRNAEGDPKIKSERKKRARELLRGTGVGPAMVARSNALIVNPTHYAVALRYASDEYPLPVVIAKGRDADALRLREAAMHFGIPIVANPPVARALHEVELDAPIPEHLFEVVAAILRWVDAIGTPAS